MNFKALSKNADGALLEFSREDGSIARKFAPWEYINSRMKQTSDLVYELDTESPEMLEDKRKIEILQSTFPSVMAACASSDPRMKLIHAAVFGKACEDWCKEFNESPADFLKEVSAYEKMFIEESLNMGASFGNAHRERIPKHLREKNDQNDRAMKSEAKGNSIGDILKAKGIEL
jgi:hypothetical protein